MASTVPCSQTIRVALVDLPPLLHAIIAGVIEAQPDVEIVHGLPVGDCSAWLRESGVDVLIVPLENGSASPAVADVWGDLAHITLLGVTAPGKRTVLYRLRPEVVELGEVSPQGLLEAARTAVGERLGHR